ncbi:LexA family transcriptional regulator [Labrys wisconsinensis]|uniref:Transcriptional regulator with XRE-family HTH domain n=1 Tax=Labrys wisconsinensis TaxID=425677 RepID=A0ABU0JG01_9HYPH|nr:S24 family peptidase [Labrys wisconsinensis]MDQ0473212.1 transcriptional regulator with XRE-family HTH domain [Labrys wisconsinensis]
MDTDAIAWIREGLARPGKSQTGLARALGRAPSAVSALLKGTRQLKAREIPLVAAYLEVSPPGAMAAGGPGVPAGFAEPAGPPPRPPGAFRIEPFEAPRLSERLTPVYGLAVGGDDGRFYFNGETVGWVKTPESLLGVRNAYALYVAEESMVPRFKPGEQVWVNPHRAPIRGDDVIVQLHPEHEHDNPEGYIKEFRGWTPRALLLWQWNPAGEIEIDRQLVRSIHVIVGRG